MNILFVVGRILYGGYFAFSGYLHLANMTGMTDYARFKGVKAAKTGVVISGIMILVGGLGILLGVYTEWAIGLIALFLIAVSFKMHAFWNISDPQTKMSEQVNFMKNMALLGADLMMLMIKTPWLT